MTEMSSEKTPPKKAKRSPIQAIKIGETMVDIQLTFVTADAIRLVQDKKVWTVIGTDGNDFLNITFWEKNLERLIRDIGTDFKSRRFMLKTFAARKIYAPYNYGSVEFELRAQESSTVALIDALPKAKQSNEEKAFFAFLGHKFSIAGDFSPIPIEKIRKGENFVDVEAELCNVRQLRVVPVQGNESRVLDVLVISQKTKTKITAWNILADFLDFLLSGKEGCTIKLQNVKVKEGLGKDEIVFVFVNTSKIEIEEKMIWEEASHTLVEAAKKTGMIKCSIRLCVARKPTAYNLTKRLDGTICTDGINKTQFVFPNSIKFEMGDEFTVNAANVDTNEAGVLTLTSYDESALIRHNDKAITYELTEIEYP